MSANNFLSYAGWAVLPNVSLHSNLFVDLAILERVEKNFVLIDGLLVQLISGWIQSLYYSITIRAGDPKPQPGTPRYQKHRKRIHVTVIVAYLLYTMYEADYWVRRDGNFYEALGVLPGAEEKQIRSRFRRLYAVPPESSYRKSSFSLTFMEALPSIIQTRLPPGKTKQQSMRTSLA